MFSKTDLKYPNRISMKELIKNGDQYNIANASFNNKITNISNKLCNVHKDTNFVVLHTYIDVNYLFDSYMSNNFDLNNVENMFHTMNFNSPLHVLNLWCNYYVGNTSKVKQLSEVLAKNMKKNKNIFIYFDFHEYSINEDKSKDSNLDYDVHSTCLLLHPDNNNQYNSYYINSHGEALSLSDCTYEKKISRKRYKTITLNYPLDFYVLNHLFKYINVHNKTYNNNVPLINYKPTKKHNYIGPNLQGGDKFGICFVFPFLIFVNIILNFRIKFTIEYNNNYYKYTSFCKLLKSNNIQKIIMLTMCNYNNNLKYIITQQQNIQNDLIEQDISCTIEKEGTKYTKYLYNILFNFIKSNQIE